MTQLIGLIILRVAIDFKNHVLSEIEVGGGLAKVRMQPCVWLDYSINGSIRLIHQVFDKDVSNMTILPEWIGKQINGFIYVKRFI